MRSRYYHAYEDRYRRVYQQGVEYWSNDPEELATTTRQLDAFLAEYSLSPSTATVIEFGCGEGHLARHLAENGFSYVGVDVSESALAKARQRVGQSDHVRFMHGDVTALVGLATDAFDVGIDNFCLQMLVVDADRRAYLSEIRRLLKPRGYAYFHQILQAGRFTSKVGSFEAYVAQFSGDYVTCEDREAFTGGQKRNIRLPRVPARFDNLEGYREELIRSGFRVEKLLDLGNRCVIHARAVEAEA
jgi:SAM-dependent methyltransferase